MARFWFGFHVRHEGWFSSCRATWRFHVVLRPLRHVNGDIVAPQAVTVSPEP